MQRRLFALANVKLFAIKVAALLARSIVQRGNPFLLAEDVLVGS
jgi:hypothetical protein